MFFSKAVEKYHDVLRCYKNSLSLDASYKAYLESIGIIYFDIKPANRQRGNGVFDNFIQSILSGLEGTESEPEEEVRVSNSRPVQDSMQDLE